MYQRILVPLDGSGTAHGALATAIGLAQAFGARLRLVHVVEAVAVLPLDPQAGGASGQLLSVMRDTGAKLLDQALAVARAAGVEADTLLYDGLGHRLGETVAEAARQWPADLVVLGTHGRRGLGRLLLGSGAEQIIRLAPVPVLVVRGTPHAPSEEP